MAERETMNHPTPSPVTEAVFGEDAAPTRFRNLIDRLKIFMAVLWSLILRLMKLTNQPAEGGNAGPMERIHSKLTLAEESVKALKMMPLWKINNEQCEYLVDKLGVVVQSARSSLEVSSGKYHGPPSSAGIARDHGSRLHVDSTRRVELFKLLLVLAKKIESYVQGCCQDEWIQAAMTLANVSGHVSSLGFNLELCRVAFCKECAATESLTSDEVGNIHEAEVKSVEQKASLDMEVLHEKVLSEQKSSSHEKKNLASYLLYRLLKNEVDPASDLPRSITENEEVSGLLDKMLNKAEELGVGGSCVVYKAQCLATPVAIKRLKGADNAQFKKEVEILGKLWHHNITSMFCCAKVNNNCFIIMELMDGDLHALMEKLFSKRSDSPPFTILESVDLMLQISEGVLYLHDQGIVHRGLKSYNILVKSVGPLNYVIAKVADFGISKTNVFSTSFSNQTYNAGTSRWIPPELINLNRNLDTESQEFSSKDEVPKYAKKSDVYSFAMLCYEILTGDLPFHEESSEKNVKVMVKGG